jgi:outer membrane lipoprotein
MKWSTLIVLLILPVALSCAPVIKRDLMSRAIVNPSLKALQKEPDRYRGRLFVLGGKIVRTRVTDEGSLVEAVVLPVDDYGYISDYPYTGGRFIARLKTEAGILDPAMFREDLEVTVAGVFRELREGRIDEGRYLFPLFDIEEIHLWEEAEPTYYIIEPFPGWFYYPYPAYPYYRRGYRCRSPGYPCW